MNIDSALHRFFFGKTWELLKYSELHSKEFLDWLPTKFCKVAHCYSTSIRLLKMPKMNFFFVEKKA